MPTKSTPRVYDAEFKRAALELLRSSGKSQRQIAHDLGVSVDALRAWQRRQASSLAATPIAEGPRTALDLERENALLRKDLAYTRRQCDILKKAMSILSAEPNGAMP